MTAHALGSHEDTNWETPPHIYKVLDDEFHFALDPCCNLDNQKAHLGYGAYTHGAPFADTTTILPDGRIHISIDGLNADWDVGGAVFINPPYSKSKATSDDTGTEMWIQKAVDWLQKGVTIVMLVGANTSTDYFQDYALKYADEIRFVNKRIAFMMNGIPKKSPTKNSMIVVFRPGKIGGYPRISGWDQPDAGAKRERARVGEKALPEIVKRDDFNVWGAPV